MVVHYKIRVGSESCQPILQKTLLNKMKDKYKIKVPVYRSWMREMENNLFPPTRPGMIQDAIDTIKKFNASIFNSIDVELSSKNYSLNIVSISAIPKNYNGSNVLLLQINAQKKNFGEDYIEFEPNKQTPMTDAFKLGSNTYFVLLHPVVSNPIGSDKIRYYWNIFIYDDPNKDSDDFLRLVKALMKELFKEPIRNIKYKDFLDEIREFNVLDNIAVELSSIEDVDPGYKAKFGNWIIHSSLRKKRTLSLNSLPSDKFKELFESDDIENVKITKKVFKITQGLKQYTLSKDVKTDAKTLKDKISLSVESCFNESIELDEADLKHIYDEDFIIKKVCPIISNYTS